MPELPEVESLRRELAETCAGQTIEGIELHRKNLRFPMQKDLVKRLSNKLIESIDRRAKFLVFKLDDSTSLISHLGMTGTWTWLTDRDHEPTKHDHVTLHLSKGILVYNDPRRFGHLIHIKSFDDKKLPFDLKSLGVEPLTDDFSAATLLKAQKSRKTASVKAVIMDQKVVVGVGNIYASEALFFAKVKPTRKFGTIKTSEAGAIVDCIRKVLSAAIKAGGSTLKDYRSLGKEQGNFQAQFMVYDREDEKCFVCKSQIKQQRIAGRSTYWCPKCQK